jgi:hypothetical protein
MRNRVEEFVKKDNGLFNKLLSWYSNRNFGMVIDPLRITILNKWILAAVSAFELTSTRAKQVNLKLKELAQIKAAIMIGCPW